MLAALYPRAGAAEIAPVAEFNHGTAPVSSISWTAEGQHLLVASDQLEIAQWHLQSRRPVRQHTLGPVRAFDYAALAWAPGQEFLVVATFNGTLRAFDKSGGETFSLRRPPPGGYVGFLSVAYSPDERFIVAADNATPALMLISTESWKVIWENTDARLGRSHRKSLSFSADGEFIFASTGVELEVFSATDGTWLRRMHLLGIPSEFFAAPIISQVWFTLNHRYAVMAVNAITRDMGIVVLDLQTEKVIYTSEGRGAILSGMISPDGSQLVVLRDAGHGILERHDLALQKIISQHVVDEFFAPDLVISWETTPPFAFSSDLQFIAVPGNTGQVRIFKVPEP